MKGISPLIASVLLIAFTVAIAGLIGTWVKTLTQTQTETVKEQAETSLICSYGSVSISDMTFCNPRLTGIVTNTGSIALGNITVQIIFNNATSYKFYLCKAGNSIINVGCNAANLSLSARESASFNMSIGHSNYDKFRIITNCSSVFDDAKSSDVSAAC